jgi:hypothetical protein
MHIGPILMGVGALIMIAGGLYVRALVQDSTAGTVEAAMPSIGYRSTVLSRGYREHEALIKAPALELAIAMAALLIGALLVVVGASA